MAKVDTGRSGHETMTQEGGEGGGREHMANVDTGRKRMQDNTRKRMHESGGLATSREFIWWDVLMRRSRKDFL